MESLSRPLHRRKLSNANGCSLSAKNAYDDVFSGQAPKCATPPSFPSAAEDYSEIFGGSRASSIPVLDLSALDEGRGYDDCRNSKLDYSKIFGGFGDDKIAVPYEELFGGARSGKGSSRKARTRSQGSDHSSFLEKKKEFSSETLDEPCDGVKHFNMSYNKTSQRRKDGPNGTTHVADLHAVPGFTYFIDENTRLQRKEGNTQLPSGNKIYNKKSPSGDTCEENVRKTESHKELSKAVKDKAGSSWDSSYSNDDSFKAGEINLKLHTSEVPPLSCPMTNESKGHPKRPNSSNCTSKTENFVRLAGDLSPSSSDEELDVNSVAAASAAALKRAIEQAQESIRMAKELMEREGIRGRKQNKSKDNRKVRVERETYSAKEKIAKESHGRVDSVLEAFTVMDGKTALRSHDIASKCSAKTVSGQTQHVMETLFSEHMDDEKCQLSTSASWQAENNIKMLQPVQKVDGFKEMKEATAQCEQGEDNIKAAENIYELGDDRKLTGSWEELVLKESVNKSASAQIIHEPEANESLRTTPEDGFTEKEDDHAKQEIHDEKWEDCQETVDEEKYDFQKFENDVLLNKLLKLVEKENEPLERFGLEIGNVFPDVSDWHENENENETVREDIEQQQVFGEEQLEEGVEDACKQDNFESRLKETCEEEEIKRETSRKASHEEKQIGCQEGQDPEMMSNGTHELETGEEKPSHAMEMRETDKGREEEYKMEDSENRLTGADNCEAIGNIGKVAENAENQDIEVTKETEKTESVQRGMDKIEENLHTSINWETLDIEDSDATFGACDNGMTSCLNEIQEACRPEVNYGMMEGQEVEPAENVGIPGFCWVEENKSVEDLLRFKEDKMFETVSLAQDTSENCAESVVKDKEDKMFETVSLAQDASENCAESLVKDEEDKMFETIRLAQDANENCAEREVKDTPRALSSDDSKGNVDFIYQNLEEQLSKAKETFEMAELIHSPKEDITEDKMQNASDSRSHDKETANCGFAQMNLGQKQIGEDDITKDKVQNVSDSCLRDKETANYGFTEMNPSQTQTEEDSRKSELTSTTDNIDKSSVHESQENKEHVKEDCTTVEKDGKYIFEEGCEERKINKNDHETQPFQLPDEPKIHEQSMGSLEEMNLRQDKESTNTSKTSVSEENDTKDSVLKEGEDKDYLKKIEANKKEREREKDRIAVERAIREARERAFTEARERAERAAVERANAEVRQRVMAEAREKLDRTSAGNKLPADKASTEAKLKAERAAVERATAEARERALEKALSQKTPTELRGQTGRFAGEKLPGASRDNGLKHSFSSSDLDKFDGSSSESAQRRKARLERHQRIMERAAKALAEKNMRDLLAQKEQAERNRLAEPLDADIKRWANGKEGNLRALLSTLQYILGPDSGWQPISLTEIITTSAVKKAYRKATLYVHPDKLQQRGASIQQKYICEKVFDLLKAAWNKFNSEER